MTEFTMQGTREVMNLAGNPDFLTKQVTALEASIEENPELAVDLARALVETVCKTILKDRGVEFDNKGNTPKLFEDTLRNMRLISTEHDGNSKAQLGMQTTIKGLQDAVLGLCQFRNAVGIASHGKDSYTPSIDRLQAIFAARAADSVIHFLYSAHKEYPKILGTTRLHYSDNENFNAFIDDIHGSFEVLAGTYLASEVLYYVDQEAYRAGLMEYEEQAEQESEDISR